MKLRFTLIFIFLTNLIIAQSYKIMTYNIRLDGNWIVENTWKDRKSDLVGLIKHYKPVIFGVQEAVSEQMLFLAESLQNYSWLGQGRDGEMKGEFSAIFYDSTQFEVLKTNTFWLSETPNKVSKGWDAAFNRVCTYALFQNRINNAKLWVFNTHFDHISSIARKNSAKLILQEIEKNNIEDLPLVLMGDFNALVTEESISILKEQLVDPLSVPETLFYGPKGSFNGFDANKIPNERIDYFFIKNLKAKTYTHIDDRMQNYHFISDHFPVLMQIYE